MKDKLYLYPLWVRLWHMFNALLFLILILTGLSLQYSSIEYPLIPFNYAVTLHNISGIALTVGFVFFLFANRFTSNGTYYQFKLSGLLKRVLKQFRYYTIGIFKNEKPPYPVTKKRKFNPMQKLSYVVVMYILMPIVIFTGIMLFFPEILPTRILGIGGIHLTDLIHIITGFAMSLFMVIHIYFCTIGKTPISNFKSMITGWH